MCNKSCCIAKGVLEYCMVELRYQKSREDQKCICSMHFKLKYYVDTFWMYQIFWYIAEVESESDGFLIGLPLEYLIESNAIELCM